MAFMKKDAAQPIISAVKSVLGAGPCSLHEPTFGGREWKYVKECIDTGWVSSVGKYVDEMEKRLVLQTGIRYAVAVVNGTAALHTSLLLLGVKAGDEVLMPTLTFVAPANAISLTGAVPHFIDSSVETLGVCPIALRIHLKNIAKIKNGQCFNRKTGRRIAALMVVHIFGHAADLDAIEAVCREFSIDFIEDAAESLGTFYKKKHTGNWGRLSAFSFNGNKIVTTGGGGAILTNDEKLAKRAKHLTTTAKLPHQWEYIHDEAGFNYRMPNINAALGCAQLERLEEFVAKKRSLAKRYEKAFSGISGAHIFKEPSFSKSNYWLVVLMIGGALIRQKTLLLAKLHDAGYLARPAWQLMHRLPMYKKCFRAPLASAEALREQIINLPSGASL